MSTTPRPRRPVCPAILVCDRVVPRTEVGKLDVIGVFDALVVPALPARLTATVFFVLTDGQGDYHLELSLEHDQTESTLGAAASDIALRAPVVVHQEFVPLAMTVSHYGTYTVKLHANDDLVAQRTFTLVPAATADGRVVRDTTARR
jgi:hypothetical protein